jgi:hypothetical protein
MSRFLLDLCSGDNSASPPIPYVFGEQEASLSRVYAGVHFRTDEAAGNRLGRAIADFVIDNYLNPVIQLGDSFHRHALKRCPNSLGPRPNRWP